MLAFYSRGRLLRGAPRGAGFDVIASRGRAPPFSLYDRSIGLDFVALLELADCDVGQLFGDPQLLTERARGHAGIER